MSLELFRFNRNPSPGKNFNHGDKETKGREQKLVLSPNWSWRIIQHSSRVANIIFLGSLKTCQWCSQQFHAFFSASDRFIASSSCIWPRWLDSKKEPSCSSYVLPRSSSICWFSGEQVEIPAKAIFWTVDSVQPRLHRPLTDLRCPVVRSSSTSLVAVIYSNSLKWWMD